MIAVTGLALGLFLTAPVYPHGGGLDANGCHHDYKNGGYHCHRSPSVSAPVTPENPIVVAPTPPPSFVGPRGGVYHYNTSGKKVYEPRR